VGKPAEPKSFIVHPIRTESQYTKLNFSSHFSFFPSLFMALFNHTELTFPVIVHGNEPAIGSVGLKAVSSQGGLKEVACLHLLVSLMLVFQFWASDSGLVGRGFAPPTLQRDNMGLIYSW
jgi:hypothetical protein